MSDLFKMVNGERIKLTPEEVAEIQAKEAAAVAEAEEAARTADLTKPQFEWLLAYTGLDDVWDALEISLKSIDRATYATLKLQRNQTNFRLPVTLKFISDLSDQIALIAPDTDLSDPTIRAAWAQALAAPTNL